MKNRIFGNFNLLNKSFVILFLLAVFVTILSGFYFFRYLFKPNTGLVENYPEVIYQDGKVVFAPTAPFSPAVSAGLIPLRDVIVKVKDRPISGSYDILAADLDIDSFRPFDVEILRDGHKSMHITLTPSFNLTRPDWFFKLIFLIVLIFTSFYLIYYLSTEKAYIFIVLACLTYLVFSSVKPFYYENLISNTLIHFGKITSWLIVFFGLYFPAPRGKSIHRTTLIFFIFSLFLFFLGFRLVLYYQWQSTGLESYFSQYRFLGKINNIADGIAYLIYLGLLGTAYIKTPLLNEKRQLEWIIAGFMIALPPYFLFDQLPIIMDSRPAFRFSMGNFANLSLIIFPIFFIIGLVKQRVLNFKFFLTRYSIYLLLSLLILFFFTVLYSPFVDFTLKHYGVDLRVASFIVTMFLFILLFPLRSFLVQTVEKIIHKRHYKRTTAYLEYLENKNKELYLIIEELNRQHLSQFQKEKYNDIKKLIKGVVNRFNKPITEITRDFLDLENFLQKFLTRRENEELVTEIHNRLGSVLVKNRELKKFVGKLESLISDNVSVSSNVDTGVLLKNAVLKVKAKHPAIEILLDLQDKIKIYASPVDIIDVLVHVFENAIEAGKMNELNVRCHSNANYCSIEIRNSGEGVSESNLKKVFYPFFTTKKGHEGLGLYMCKTIVERNQGTIEIKSEEAEGTLVSIALPLERTASDFLSVGNNQIYSG